MIITVTGIGAGQIVLLLATPILARIYTPSEFGIYAAIVSFASVVGTIASLRYETSIPVISAEKIPEIGRLAVILPLIISPLVVCGITLMPTTLGVLKGPAREGSLAIIAIVGALQGVVAVAYAICTRRGDFLLASVIRILQPAAFVAGAWLLMRNLSQALVFSWLIALVAAIYSFRNLNFITGWSTSLRTAHREWRYPLLYAPVSLLDNLTLAMPILATALIYGDVSAGNYSQVQRLLGAPLLLIGLAVGQVFFKHAGDILRQAEPLNPIFLKTFRNLCLAGISLVLVVWFAGEWLVSLILGPGWRTDSIFLLVVLLPTVFRSVVSPITSVFLLCHKLKIVAVWQILYFLTMFAIVALTRTGYAFEDFLLALVVGELIMYSSYFLLAWSVVSRTDLALSRRQ